MKHIVMVPMWGRLAQPYVSGKTLAKRTIADLPASRGCPFLSVAGSNWFSARGEDRFELGRSGEVCLVDFRRW